MANRNKTFSIFLDRSVSNLVSTPNFKAYLTIFLVAKNFMLFQLSLFLFGFGILFIKMRY